jgi:hypothetical protein
MAFLNARRMFPCGNKSAMRRRRRRRRRRRKNTAGQ